MLLVALAGSTVLAGNTLASSESEFFFRYKYPIIVDQEPTVDPLQVDVSSGAPATVGQPWSTQAFASGGTGGPYAFSLTPSGSWLGIDQSTGQMSGTPAGAGPSSFTVTADDGEAQESKTFMVAAAMSLAAVHPDPIETAPGSDVDATIGVTGGKPPMAYSWDPSEPKPDWLDLDSSTGKVSGVAEEGSWTPSVIVTDSEGRTTTANLIVDVSGSLPIGTVVAVDGSGHDQYSAASGMAVDSAGNSYIVGSTPSGGGDVVITKLTPSGQMAWTKTFGSSTGNETGKNVAISSSGDIFVLGGSSSEAMLLKLSPSGSLLWSKLLNGLGSLGTYASVLSASPDGGVYMGAGNGLVSKFDANGTHIWSESPYSWGTSDTTVAGLASDSTGVYATGTTRNNYGDSFYSITKLKQDTGEIAWSISNQSISKVIPSAATGVFVAGDGNVYMTGKALNANIPGVPAGYGRTILAKFDGATGLQAWQKVIMPTITNTNQNGTAITMGNDGALYVASASNSYGSMETGWSVTKLDTDGNAEWMKSLNGFSGLMTGPSGIGFSGDRLLMGGASWDPSKGLYTLRIASLPTNGVGSGEAGEGFSFVDLPINGTIPLPYGTEFHGPRVAQHLTSNLKALPMPAAYSFADAPGFSLQPMDVY